MIGIPLSKLRQMARSGEALTQKEKVLKFLKSNKKGYTPRDVNKALNMKSAGTYLLKLKKSDKAKTIKVGKDNYYYSTRFRKKKKR